MENVYSTAESFRTVRRIVHDATFWLVLILVGLVMYFSEMPLGTNALMPLYYHKVLGLDILDYLTFGLIVLAFVHVLLERRILVTKFHKYLFIILFIYGIAMINGFVYGQVFRYPYKKWFQDIQQVSYLFVYFTVVFAVCRSSQRWQWIFRFLIIFALLKNLTVLADFLGGRGIQLIHTTTITAKGADAMLLSILFYPVITYLVWGEKRRYVKLLYLIPLFLFLLNSLTNVGRTVWLLLIVSFGYLLYEAGFRRGIKILLLVTLILVLVIGYLQVQYPRFVSFARWRLVSTLNLSISRENLSNATRVMEIKNILHRLFKYASFIQGMGLGAWWDDQRYLLPAGDVASGFVGKTRFFHTHLWFLTQLLKIGLVGTVIYWTLISKMLWITRRKFLTLKRSNPYRLRLLALNVIFFNLAFCAAGFLRLFICMGVILALMARGICISDEYEY